MPLGSGGGIKWDLLSLHCSFQGDIEMELLFAALLLTVLHCSKKLFIPVNDFCLLTANQVSIPLSSYYSVEKHRHENDPKVLCSRRKH